MVRLTYPHSEEYLRRKGRSFSRAQKEDIAPERQLMSAKGGKS
jgi:hypothetical protein